MAIHQCTCRWQVAEPLPLYKKAVKIKKSKKRRVRWATVLTQHYPPLQSNPHTSWRKIPWINLKGYWLEQAGFEIGATYRIEVSEKALRLTVKD